MSILQFELHNASQIRAIAGDMEKSCVNVSQNAL